MKWSYTLSVVRLEVECTLQLCTRVFNHPRAEGTRQSFDHDVAFIQRVPTARTQGALQKTLACGGGPSPHQNYVRDGNPDLQKSGDGRKRNVGLFFGLQSQSITGGTIGVACRYTTKTTELQTYRSTVVSLVPTNANHGYSNK